MASKVMNVIMKLNDKMSQPLKKVSKAMERTSQKLEKTNSKLAKLKRSTGYYSKKVTEAKSKLEELSKATGDNKTEIEKATKQVKKYEKALEYKKRRIEKTKQATLKYKKVLGELRAQQKKVEKAFKTMTSGAVKAMDKLVLRTAKLGTAITGLAAGLGFKEAFDMEGYKVQLETATKDTEKASKLMVDAVKFANDTPFETGSVVEATAKMEVYGLSSKRWLKDVADMAGATNKSIDQATEAMADGVMGEFERLKEFGIKKEMLVAAANKKYGSQIVFNNKGQILDQIKLQDILQEEMQKRFSGGAEKLAKTSKGLWSTVTGITKTSLAKIVGMQSDGTIKQASLYAKLKLEIQKVVDVLTKWSNDGTIEKISSRVTEAFSKVIAIIKSIFEIVSKYRTFIEPLAVMAGVIYTTIKAFQALKVVMIGVNIAMGILNGTLAFTPLGIVAIAIGVLAGALYLLWRHFDSIIKVMRKAWNWFRDVIDTTSSLTLVLTGPIAPLLLLIKHFEKLKEIVSGVWDVIKGIFKSENKDININVNERQRRRRERQRRPEKSRSMQKFAQGGIANKASIFGEAGPEIAIPLKNTPRSKVLLEEANKSIGGGSGITVIIKGDVYGFEDFKEKVAEAFVKITEQVGPNTVGV